MFTLKQKLRWILHFVFIGTFLVGCNGTSVVDIHFEGEVDHYTQDSKSPIQTVSIDDNVIKDSSLLFPIMSMKMDALSMQIRLSSHFSNWIIHNQSNKTIRFRFDELRCVGRDSQTLSALPLNGILTGLISKEDKRVTKLAPVTPIEINPTENRWIDPYPKFDKLTIFNTCSWRKNGEAPKEIKDLSDLIGTEFALALPYESEEKTGQYVFRLKIKNVGSRVSYF